MYEVADLKHPFLQYKQIMKILKKNKYDMTYFNISTAISIIGPFAAYKSNIKKEQFIVILVGMIVNAFGKGKYWMVYTT